MEMRKLFSKIQLTHMHKKQVDRLVQFEKKWVSNSNSISFEFRMSFFRIQIRSLKNLHEMLL